MSALGKFKRKNIRLPAESYIGERLYFLTLCCEERRPVLDAAKIVARHLEVLRETSLKMEFAVHAYCFMPDHLHLLVVGLSPQSRLLDYVSRFKQLSGYDYKQKHGATLWQRRYYDHVLRQDSEMHDVAWYIWMNPVRKGLAREPRAYPFSGSFSLDWSGGPPKESWTPPWKRP